MKLNKLFHWLYFSVMALPLVVAPIFAIFSHRHDISEATSYTEQVAVYYDSNEVESINDIYVDNIYKYTPSYVPVDVGSENTICDIDSDFAITQFPMLYNLDVTRCRLYYVPNSFLRLVVVYNVNGTTSSNTFNVSALSFNFIPISIDTNLFQSTILNNVSFTDYQYLKEYQDVTTSFDKDIMASFVNNYADTIDKYFNYDNVVNFSSLYTWLNTTFFNSQAPLGFFIFWHLLIYWLLTSILWLVFDVLMYVPQLVHRWLDKASIS